MLSAASNIRLVSNYRHRIQNLLPVLQNFQCYHKGSSGDPADTFGTMSDNTLKYSDFIANKRPRGKSRARFPRLTRTSVKNESSSSVQSQQPAISLSNKNLIQKWEILSKNVKQKNKEKKKQYGKLKNYSSHLSSIQEAKIDNKGFGSLSNRNYEFEFFEGDEGDKRQEEYLARKNKIPNRDDKYYGEKINDLLKENNLKDALLVIDEMKNDNAKICRWSYELLMSACGRKGYTKRAFSLYREMKSYNLKIRDCSYTSLLNSCATSPFPEYGLKKLKGLHDYFFTTGKLLNQKHYHAMIKAYGRLCDIEIAFGLVDEMIKNNIFVTTETVNFLLQAALSDKNAGFRHAIMVWHKMRMLRLLPDHYSYRLLARITSECEAGDPKLFSHLITQFPTKPKEEQKKIAENKREEQEPLPRPKEFTHSRPLVQEWSHDKSTLTIGGTPPEVEEEPKLAASECDAAAEEKRSKADDGCVFDDGSSDFLPTVVQEEEEFPSLLARTPSAGTAVNLVGLEVPQHRLALLGGTVGFLQQMLADNVSPDVQVFSNLIPALPRDMEAIRSFFNSMEEVNVEPDVIIFNLLLKSRRNAVDSEGVRELLERMAEHRISFDIATWGCLSFKLTRYGIIQHLKDMNKAGVVPNKQIFLHFLRSAKNLKDFFIAKLVMDKIEKQEMPVSKDLLLEFEEMRVMARTFIISKDQKSHREMSTKDIQALEETKDFVMCYKRWLKSNKFELPLHPWQQFRTEKEKKSDDADSA